MRIVCGSAFVVLGLVSLELCTRAVRAARTTWRAVGSTPPRRLALVALATGVTGLAAARGAPRARAAMLFATLFAFGIPAQINLGARLQSDGFYYFAYLRSIAFDRDVEFSNDYRLIGLGDKPHLFELA